MSLSPLSKKQPRPVKAPTKAEFLALCAPEEDPVPEGWLTIHQMCNLYGLSKPCMRRRLRILLGNGDYQTHYFYLRRSRGLTRVPHYAPALHNPARRSKLPTDGRKP